MGEHLKPKDENIEKGKPLSRVFDLRDAQRSKTDQLLKMPRWRKHREEEVAREKGELQRTAEQLGLDYSSLEHAFASADLEELSASDWEVMINTDSRDTWTKEEVIGHIGSKRDHESIFQGLEDGAELPAPIVLFRDGEPPYLIGGNTRRS